MASQPASIPDCAPCPTVQELQKMATNHEKRIADLETMADKMDNVLGLLEKIGKQIRFWAPTFIGAAVSAGIVNGKLGAFLHALVNGGVGN